MRLAACRSAAPARASLILEARERIGGTWDLFRYPGVRSNSDMFTLGFPFRPWRSRPGDRRRRRRSANMSRTQRASSAYSTASDSNARDDRASWSSSDSRWTVEDADSGASPAAFLYLASGYYDYAQGLSAANGRERTSSRAGSSIPNSGPTISTLLGKNVAVIGSGATAVTLVPAIAERGGARDHGAALAKLHRRRGPRATGCAGWLHAAPPALAERWSAGKTCC